MYETKIERGRLPAASFSKERKKMRKKKKSALSIPFLSVRRLVLGAAMTPFIFFRFFSFEKKEKKRLFISFHFPEKGKKEKKKLSTHGK